MKKILRLRSDVELYHVGVMLVNLFDTFETKLELSKVSCDFKGKLFLYDG